MTDTIEYSGLTSNKSYTIKGWLVDFGIGNPAVDAVGNATKITDGTSQMVYLKSGMTEDRIF